ncbi:hypothetical protein AGMMS49975_03640 [Clostridia bacterium]|nr:hypothetical protein AGMMS49975_03640 [Clostridia bacterium]
MKKKRIFAAATASLMLISTLGACAPKATTGTTTPSTTATTTAEDTGFDPSKFQVKAIDEKTFEVTLNTPIPYFLELTAFPTFMPVQKNAVETGGDAWATKPETYVGTGAFRMTEFVNGSHITLEKNPNYWDAANVTPEKLTLTLTDDAVAQLDGFQTGKFQFIDDIPTNEIDQLMNNPDFVREPQLGTYYASLNNQKAPFDNPLVRKAFSLAVDREYISKNISKGWIPAGAFVPPTSTDNGKEFGDNRKDYIDVSDGAYEKNLAEAKSLLAEAGYPDGAGLPNIEYIYNEGSIHRPVAEALQDMWGKLGAKVSIESQEWSTFLNTRKHGEYMAARDGWVNDYSDPIGMLDLFVTGNGNNNAQYSNPEYDKLIASIKSETDQTKRSVLLHQAEDMLFADSVFVPLLYYTDYYMVAPQVKSGIWSTPIGWKFFRKAPVSELDVVLGPNPDTIDPALNSAVDAGIMILTAFDGLYRYDEQSALEPSLAESVDVSEDGLTYTFHLRDGLKWSDGTPLTAEDFVYSWTRAINPETAADYSEMFNIIKGYNDALGVTAE